VKEKIYEIAIDHPLTPKRRKVIDKYIEGNSHLMPLNLTLSHDWEEDEEDPILRINTPPVSWEVVFLSDIVEVYGAGPLWARLLFTEKKKTLLKEQIELLLHDTGFIAGKPKGAKAVAGLKRPR
jgi:hypothetical protein